MKSLTILAMACTAALGISTAGFAADPSGPSDTKPPETKAETKAPADAKAPSDAKAETKTTLAPAEIKGEVLRIDGDNYFVNDERSKKEVKMTIEKDVKATLERPLKQGDRIEAFLTPEGLAKKVRLEGAKDISEAPAAGGFSKEAPAGEKSSKPDQGGMKPPAEGSNPTLSPGGKGSASGG
jgi:hypothetical protein